MDGVITNTMPDHYRSWKTVLSEEGLHVTYEDIYKREGQPGISSVRELSKEYQINIDEKRAAQSLVSKLVRSDVAGVGRVMKRTVRSQGKLSV